MQRYLRHLLLAAALIFGQYAVNQHALYHTGLELAHAGDVHSAESATADADSAHDHAHHAPESDHPTDRCLSYVGAGGAPLTCATPVLAFEGSSPAPHFYFELPLPRAPRIAFHSRAPPAFFS